MKISSINTTKYNQIQNAQNGTLTQTKMSTPMNFKGNYDSFEFSNPKLEPLDIDKASLPENVRLSVYGEKNCEQLVGKIANKSFTMQQRMNKYSGYYDGDSFDYKLIYGFFSSKNKGISGTVDTERFEIKSTNIDDNIFMIGNIGYKPIKIEGIEDHNFSRLKGKIGEDSIDLTVKFAENEKEIKGKINDKKFVFSIDADNVIGGTESNSELFPIIFALINRREAPTYYGDNGDYTPSPHDIAEENMMDDLAHYGG